MFLLQFWPHPKRLYQAQHGPYYKGFLKDANILRNKNKTTCSTPDRCNHHECTEKRTVTIEDPSQRFENGDKNQETNLNDEKLSLKSKSCQNQRDLVFQFFKRRGLRKQNNEVLECSANIKTPERLEEWGQDSNMLIEYLYKPQLQIWNHDPRAWSSPSSYRCQWEENAPLKSKTRYCLDFRT